MGGGEDEKRWGKVWRSSRKKRRTVRRKKVRRSLVEEGEAKVLVEVVSASGKYQNRRKRCRMLNMKLRGWS